MYALVRLQLLSQDGNIVIRSYQGIERVDALPWVTSCVGTPSGELAMDFFAGVHQNSTDAFLGYPREEFLWTCMTIGIQQQVVTLTGEVTYAINEMSTPS